VKGFIKSAIFILGAVVALDGESLESPENVTLWPVRLTGELSAYAKLVMRLSRRYGDF
jgi:hypothetical protein